MSPVGLQFLKYRNTFLSYELFNQKSTNFFHSKEGVRSRVRIFYQSEL